MLHEEFPKLKLEIYGDGTLRDSLSCRLLNKTT
jgi:hypothetical protein